MEVQKNINEDQKYNFLDYKANYKPDSLKNYSNQSLVGDSNNKVIALEKLRNNNQETDKKGISHYSQVQDNFKKGIIEKERIIYLGQLLKPATHNLKTPAISISGNLYGLELLIKEYKESLEDKNVTIEDHLEIADEMICLIQGMKDCCANVFDIIRLFEEQTFENSRTSDECFSIEDVLKRVELILSYELIQKHCELKLRLNAHPKISFYGNLNDFTRIVVNLVLNAIQSYDGMGGEIILEVNQNNGEIRFKVEDNGKGIPSKVQGRLFKEIITTKEITGTGMSVYVSNLFIRECYKGKMWFESKEGEGTKFYFSLPVKTNS